MRKWSRMMRSQGKTIGFVPTMDFLHEGHISLVTEAHRHADVVVVSIYVNPGQFSPTEDLSVYPYDFDGDVRKLVAVPGDVDVVFHPHNLYDYEGTNISKKPASVINNEAVLSCIEQKGMVHETWVRVDSLEKGLCDKSRLIFFRGVATVVTKLFTIVEPDVVVFGKKDYKQWRIIQRMVRDLDFSIKVTSSAIMRDNDGLAMSSRNVRLSPKTEGAGALSINKSLLGAKIGVANGQIDCNTLRHLVIQAISESGGRIDYAEIVDQESLEAMESIKASVVFCVAAAWFGNIRLVDNMEINL